MRWYCRLVIKKCAGLISLQLGPLIWETASPKTHTPKIVSESLKVDVSAKTINCGLGAADV